MPDDMGPIESSRPRVAAVIAAGGQGTRMGAAAPKQWLSLGGRPLLEWSIAAFARSPVVDELVVVLPARMVGEEVRRLAGAGKPARAVAGGKRRQDSVAAGFAAVSADVDVVVVHDAARPFVSAALIAATVEAALEAGAAVAATPARDTIKLARHDGEAHEPATVERTIPRELVYLAQTPQAFRREVLAAAIAAGAGGSDATDEAVLAERAGFPVRIVEGEPGNMKITTAEDLRAARARAGEAGGVRVGVGYDLHRLVEGRPLVIGGVVIPFDLGLAGHSDADVLAHAITDAVLGAAAAGDIGRHFPDSDARWRGASSLDLLARAASVVRDAGYAVLNVDAVVIAERPRLAPHLDRMRANLAAALGIGEDRVAVKGKTNEGAGETGRGEAMAAHAVALVTATAP